MRLSFYTITACKNGASDFERGEQSESACTKVLNVKCICGERTQAMDHTHKSINKW